MHTTSAVRFDRVGERMDVRARLTLSRNVMRRTASRISALSLLLAAALLASIATGPNAKAAPESYRPYSCGANQGNGCVVAPTFNADGTEKADQVNVLSYGSHGSYQNIFFSGLDKIHCKPHGGKHADPFTCQIQPVDLPKVTEWVTCTPTTAGNCNPTMAPQYYRIARYGSGSRWVYQFVSGSFQCPVGAGESFAGIQLDPMTGDNAIRKTDVSCQWSKEDFPAIPRRRWTTCTASANVDCRFPSPGDYLVRVNLGAGTGDLVSNAYRTVTGSKIACNASFLGASESPGTNRWSCEYLPLPTFLRVKGDWNLVGLCSNCDNVSFNVTSGVEKGSAKDTESAFTWQLGASMSASAGSPLTVEATVDISANYTNDSRNIVSNSFTQNQSTSFSIECGSGSLYQWVTGVEEVCMPGNAGNCVSVARSNVFRCLPSDLPPGQPPVQFGVAATPVAVPAGGTTPSGSTTPASTTPSATTSGTTTPTSTPPATTTPTSTTPKVTAPTSTAPGGAAPSSPPASTTTTTVVSPPDTMTACTDTWTTNFKRNLTVTKDRVKRLLKPEGQEKLEVLQASDVTQDQFLNICVKNGGPAF